MAVVDEADLEDARQAAMRSIGSGEARRDAVRLAARRFMDSADRAIAERHEYPAVLLTGRFSSPRPSDRAALLKSLERAVVAVIVWEDLTAAERDVLLGPWAVVTDRAFGAEEAD